MGNEPSSSGKGEGRGRLDHRTRELQQVAHIYLQCLFSDAKNSRSRGVQGQMEDKEEKLPNLSTLFSTLKQRDRTSSSCKNANLFPHQFLLIIYVLFTKYS